MTATVVRRDAWRRWLLVAAAALVVAGLPVAVGALPVHTARIPPADLVARVRASAHQPYRGYAISNGSAGLPSLPQLAGVSALLDGETQLRAWYAAPDRWRVDELGAGTERDLYQTPQLQAQWDFGSDTLTAITGTPQVRLPRGADLVPPDLGRRLLAAGTAGLSALPARRVAGIAAAGVRLTPPPEGTTIGHVDVWADPRTGLPLQVEITARGAATPVLVSRFLEISLTPPAPSVLAPPVPGAGMGFTAPDAPDVAGALGTLALGPLPDRLAGWDRAGALPARVAGAGAYGSGLTQFVVLPVSRGTGLSAFRSVTHAGGVEKELPDGEYVLVSTPLVSVAVVDSDLARRTYVLAGLVDGTVLATAATQLSSYRSRP